MSNDRTDAVAEVRGRMGFDEREVMMCYLLRHHGVFLEARSILSPEHFTEPYEIIWAVCWRSMLDLYDQFGAMPPHSALEADALCRVEEHPTEIPSSGVDEMRDFLAYMFDVDVASLSGCYEQYGFELLQKFLKERHWTDPIRSYLHDLGRNVPVDLPALMKDYGDRLTQIDGIQVNVMEPVIPESWEPEAIEKIPTGLDFIDSPMGGGGVQGEIYGLLGPYGSGKTMLAGQIASEMAERFAARASTTRTPPKHVFFFSYEMPVDEIRRRIISYVAKVNLNHLSGGSWTSTLSRTGRRHPYEERLLPQDPRGEYERVEDARGVTNLLHIANMRGDRRAPKAGSGWVDEIHAELEKFRRRHGGVLEVGQVFIDYALICTRRYLKAKGWDEDRKLRHLVGTFGDECRRMISDHFGCSTWILNQMSGEANKKSPASAQHYADSAEARNFAENLTYAFCLGNKDRETNCAQLVCGKTRRSEGSPRPTILKLYGELARFEAADDRYMVDASTHRIITRQQADVVPAVAYAAQPGTGSSSGPRAGGNY